MNHYEGEVGDILRELIEKHDINVLGTGGLSSQFHIVKNIVSEAKRINDGIITIVGGNIISSDPEVAMKALEFVDYGVRDNGEETIVELARYFEHGDELSNIKGLIYEEGGQCIQTNPRITANDQDAIPWPDYEGFELGKYLDLPSPSSSGLNSSRLVNMMIGRSCPYRCTFCFRSDNQLYKRRSLDDFFAHVDYLIEKFDINHISIIDELFLPGRKDVKEFCERMKEYDITWDADFSVRNIRFELLPLMKESGLNLMQFGLESADNGVLESMEKGFTVEKMETVLKEVHNYGIPIFGAFIFGDPAETTTSATRTLKWWREHQEFVIHLTLIKPYPGTVLYRNAVKDGVIADPVQYLKDGCPQINLSSMSDEEFAKLARDISDASDISMQLDDASLLEFDSEQGRMVIAGTCPVCSHKNKWDEIKLFSINYLACEHCAQAFNIPLFPTIRKSIEDNLDSMLDRCEKVGVWGMTLSAMELFKSAGVFSDPRVFPIDISASKQNMDLYGQVINSPEVLNQKKISTVVISVPFYVSQIANQIKENHPSVTEVIDICNLVDPVFHETAPH
jgi:anaerobic magnesium-protoporphyrin IX monomethyl ester cyclase